MSPTPNLKNISFTFREGRYLDLWSIVHFLAGVLLAMVLITYVDLTLPWALASATTLILLWEFFEMVIGIGEHTENRFTDILLGIAGFGVAVLYLPLGDGQLLTALFLLTLFLDILGVRSYITRASEENRV